MPRNDFTGVRKTGNGMFDAYQRFRGQTIKLGRWLRQLDAAVARDRAVLWLGLDLPLHLPSEARALGPCSPEDLRRIALGERKRARGASPFRGVGWNKEKCCVYVRVGGVSEAVVGFDSEEEAAIAYDRIAIGLGAGRSKLNFPDRQLDPISASDLRRELRARQTKTTGASAYFGVCLAVRRGRSVWRASIKRDGVLWHIGSFDDEREAAIAYDRVARAWRGAEARLNFPDEPWPATSLEDLRAELRARSKATTTSQYLGVSWAESSWAWRASITVDGTHYHLGLYDDEAAAARAYDRKRFELRGRGPYNFPDEL